MKGSARHRQLLAFGLAALLHVGLAVIPLPRSARNPARPGIQPAAMSVEIEVVAPASGPAGDAAQPEAAAGRTVQPAQPGARAARVPQVIPVSRVSARVPRVPRVPRVDDSHAQRVSAHALAPRSRVEVAPAEPHPDGASTSGLRPVSLDLSDHAAGPALDGLSGHVPAGPGASASGRARPGMEARGQQTPGQQDIDRHAYALRVRGLVEARKRYPARARRLGQEGEVSVRVRIAPDGRLLGQPRVTASSGAEALDREALRMVRQASPFPPSGAATAVELAVPVRFAVDER